MNSNTYRREEWNKTALQLRNNLGKLGAVLIFWVLMLALLSCPVWLPALVEMTIH